MNRSNTLTSREDIFSSTVMPLTDDTWLVEIRLGRTKMRIRELVRSVAAAYHADEYMERHPHVTLYGPFTLTGNTSPQNLLSLIGTAASRFGPVPFIIDGWEKREGMHGSVIAFTIHPSGDLRALVTEIAKVLHPHVESMNAWDGRPEEKWYHSTITNRMDPAAADSIFHGLSGPGHTPAASHPHTTGLLARLRTLFAGTQERQSIPAFHPPLLDETGLRITIMRGEHIYAEYDLLERRWVMTGHDHASLAWQKTLQAYRYRFGQELRDPVPPPPGSVFVISDLHLGHANIIRYCSRPFLHSDPREMDHVLIKNWNYSILPSTKIYHLGDIRYGKDAPPLDWYRRKLHGQITWIPGNHDDQEPGGLTSVRLVYGDREFLLLHDPADAPPDFAGWVIHGHHHNNNLREFPFINIVSRRINVCPEVTGYLPVSLDELSRTIDEREASGTTSPILLRNFPLIPSS